MKKLLILSVLSVIVILLPGCTDLGLGLGANSDWRETRAQCEKYQVTNPAIRGQSSTYAVCILFIPVWMWGDNSFATAKALALANAPGSDDMINISKDTRVFDAVFFKKQTIILNGTAIKYVK